MFSFLPCPSNSPFFCPNFYINAHRMKHYLVSCLKAGKYIHEAKIFLLCEYTKGNFYAKVHCWGGILLEEPVCVKLSLCKLRKGKFYAIWFFQSVMLWHGWGKPIKCIRGSPTSLAHWCKNFPLCMGNFCKGDHDYSQGDFTQWHKMLLLCIKRQPWRTILPLSTKAWLA